MALQTLKSIQTRVSKDGSSVQLALIFDSGINEQMQATPEVLAKIVFGLLKTLAAIPPREAVAHAAVSDDAVPVNGMAFTPAPDSSSDAVLVLLVGSAPLQFQMPIDAAMEALRALEEKTESDPTAHRPH